MQDLTDWTVHTWSGNIANVCQVFREFFLFCAVSEAVTGIAVICDDRGTVVWEGHVCLDGVRAQTQVVVHLSDRIDHMSDVVERTKWSTAFGTANWSGQQWQHTRPHRHPYHTQHRTRCSHSSDLFANLFDSRSNKLDNNSVDVLSDYRLVLIVLTILYNIQLKLIQIDWRSFI